MYLILFAFVGLVASLVARLVRRRKQTGLPAVSVVVGILGALAGGVLGRSIGLHGDATELAGLVLSISGAATAVMGYHAYAARRASASKPMR